MTLAKSDLIRQILALDPDDLIEVKGKIISSVDKKRYAKEALSSLSAHDAELTIKWIKEKYGIV